jgi:hypothetical protein
MTPSEWKKICNNVTDAMVNHTRPFVTPLSTSDNENVRLVGSGSYVKVGNHRILLTCEHVARVTPMEYRFNGSDSVFRHSRSITMEKFPIDAAFATISDVAWNKEQHKGMEIPYEKFSLNHRVADRSELLFFRGYAGENARYGFDIHETNGSGYCSQEKVVCEPDQRMFEIFWEHEKIEFTESTPQENRANIKHEDPHGFSGSLVWNTRYKLLTKNSLVYRM